MIRAKYESSPKGEPVFKAALYRKLGIKRSFIKPRITDICPLWNRAKLSERVRLPLRGGEYLRIDGILRPYLPLPPPFD